MADELFDVLAAAVAPLGLELVDVELRGKVARVVVDREGGIDLDAVAAATRAISPVLDDHDPFPDHKYSLEVSSPGVERTLRTPRHFTHAIGEVVSVRTYPGTEGERRIQGRLVSVDDAGMTLEGEGLPDGGRRIAFDEVERARTVFVWGGEPRRSGDKRHGSAQRRAARPAAGADREKVTTP